MLFPRLKKNLNGFSLNGKLKMALKIASKHPPLITVGFQSLYRYRNLTWSCDIKCSVLVFITVIWSAFLLWKRDKTWVLVQLDFPTLLSVQLKPYINLGLTGRSGWVKLTKSHFFLWQNVICHKAWGWEWTVDPSPAQGSAERRRPAPQPVPVHPKRVPPDCNCLIWSPVPRRITFFLTLNVFQLWTEPFNCWEFLYSVFWRFLFSWLLKFSCLVISRGLSHLNSCCLKFQSIEFWHDIFAMKFQNITANCTSSS